MVHCLTETLDNVFFALSDSVRRQILSLLLKKDTNIASIASHFQITLQAVIKHIKILERAHLVIRRKHGRENICQINAKPLTEATDFIQYYTDYWNNNLDNLSEYLDSTGEKEI